MSITTRLAMMLCCFWTVGGQARAGSLWLGVIPNQITPGGFSANPDFPELVSSTSRWSRALSQIGALKVTERYVLKAPEGEVRQMFTFLRAHHVGVAAVFGMVTADNCGKRVEGMTGSVKGTLKAAQRYQELGADVAYIVADEPATFGHYSTKGEACQYSLERVADSYGDNIRAVKSVFPRAQVVDIEAMSAFGSPEQLGQWVDVLQARLGADAPKFVHLDIQWNREWREEAPAMVAALKRRHIGYGIIYNASARDNTDESWIAAARSHILAWERIVPDRPDQVVIQSWNPNPSHTLPETDPTSLTSLVDWYCEHTARPVGCS